MKTGAFKPFTIKFVTPCRILSRLVTLFLFIIAILLYMQKLGSYGTYLTLSQQLNLS